MDEGAPDTRTVLWAAFAVLLLLVLLLLLGRGPVPAVPAVPAGGDAPGPSALPEVAPEANATAGPGGAAADASRPAPSVTERPVLGGD